VGLRFMVVQLKGYGCTTIRVV
jgi:hypothetical protein